MRVLVLGVVAGLAAACGAPAGNPDAGDPDSGELDGGQGDAGFDGGNVDHGAPSTTYPAFNIDWPYLVNTDAGVIKTPRLVVVTFDGDALRAELESFATAIGTGTYWQKTASEYGVGVPTVGTPVHLALTPPALLDDNDVQTFLTQQLDGTHPEWPAADDRTIYLLYYPSTTTMTLPGGLASCTNFGGYHSSLNVGGKLAAYAVLPRCGPNVNVPAVSTELGALTGVTSHEILEAVTDVDGSGYRLPPDRHIAFASFAGAENGDMCEFNEAAWIVDSEINFTVQRTWSNVEALAGREPCVPAPTGPHFTAVPAQTDAVGMSFGAASLVTQGIALAQGESKTVQLLLVSTGDTGGPFKVSAKSRQEFFGLGHPLSFSFDRDQGVNGEKIYMTITRTGNDPNFGGAIPFAVISKQGNVTTYWFSVVGGT